MKFTWPCRVLFLTFALTIHAETNSGQPQAVHGNDGPNQFKTKWDALVAKVKADVAAKKSALRQQDAKLHEIDDIKAKIAQADTQTNPEFKRVLLADLNPRLQKAQSELQVIRTNLSAVEARIKQEQEAAQENKVAMGMYHINSFDDLDKATFLQPWVVDKMPNRFTNFAMEKGAFTVPLTNNAELTGTFEAARLTKDKSNGKLFNYDPKTSNGIKQIENTGDYTVGFLGFKQDAYIWVTFRDGGKIWYKQPRGGAWRRRDHADTWMKGNEMGWAGMENGHTYASGKTYGDYPDEILLLRAPAPGESTEDVDYSIIADKRQNHADGVAETAAGIIVEGTGVAFTAFGFFTGAVFFEPVAAGCFIWLIAGGGMIGDGLRRIFA